MNKKIEDVEGLAKEMYEDICNIVHSVDMIPMPYATWLQRVTLGEFLTFVNIKYRRFEEDEDS